MGTSNKVSLTREEIIRQERKLAKFANLMDSVVRIPFTKQGVGADAALSTVPFAGDITGLLLTGYAFILGRRMGVPTKKMMPAVRLAIADLFIGLVPVAGTLMDIFIRPSRKTLEIVRAHNREHYDLPDDLHMNKPFLHQSLERRQATSAFWRHKTVAWLWLHIPDFLGLCLLILIGLLLYGVFAGFRGLLEF